MPLECLELYKQHTHTKNASWLPQLLSAERVRLEEIKANQSVSIAGLMHWRMIADGSGGRARA